MTTMHRFLLPDVGEGLTEAEIVQWLVSVGDRVEVNQTLVEIETAKSIVELPSPFGGRITVLHAEAGETVPVAAPLVSIETADAPGQAGDDEASRTQQWPASEGEATLVALEASLAATADQAPDAVEFRPLVGYGASSRVEAARPRTRVGPVPPAADGPPSGGGSVRAKPPVRRLAKDNGIDLSTITPSESGGTVSREDVIAAMDRTRVAAVDQGGMREDLERIPIRGVRKRTAEAVSSSAFTAPHVTEFLTIDVTETLRLKEIVQRRREFRDIKLTFLTFAARAYLRALERTPVAKARWDESAGEIVIPRAVRLGIAAATPRGLMVPVIPDAHELDLRELALAIAELAERARAGATPPHLLSGGTTTITNIGVFGVDAGTPILNPGETAILAIGTIRRMPWVVGDGDSERIEPRSVLQLALSFDHRVMDGNEGSALLADTGAILAEPGLGLL